MRAAAQAGFDVSEALPESDLGESHCEKLVSGSHTFTDPWHRVKGHAAIELLAMDKISDLSENKASSIYSLLRMN